MLCVAVFDIFSDFYSGNREPIERLKRIVEDHSEACHWSVQVVGAGDTLSKESQNTIHMKVLLDKLRKVEEDACLSIIFNTHRTSPESQQDIIALKNLMREGEAKLREEFPKDADKVMSNLNDLVESIDHLYNLDSMAIFVNSRIAEMVRLEIPVRDRAEVHRRFVLRDVMQAGNQSSAYYVLVLSRRQARLFEAYNNLVVKEEVDSFPIINEVIEVDPHRLTMAAGTDNLIENFFKQVDNEVTRIVNAHRLPLVVVTEERNFFHYEKVTGLKDLILGHLSRNRDEEEARLIAQDAWPIVKSKILESNEGRVEDLKKGTSSGHVMTDINDILRAIKEGRGRTLFIKKGLYQPGKLSGERIEFVDAPNGDVRPDVLDEVITGSVNYGGEVVFLDSAELDEFDGVALLTRY